jgi:hypothetical protein
MKNMNKKLMRCGMAQMLILENEFYTLWYYTDKKIVHHKIKKFIHGNPLREMLLKGMETLKEYKATKWLSDDRLNAALSKEDTEWAQTVWFPQTVAAGWKHWALIQPDNVIGQMNIKRFTEMYAQLGVNVGVFSDPKEAAKWLMAQ